MLSKSVTSPTPTRGTVEQPSFPHIQKGPFISNDPQKNQWGGRSSRNGLALSAKVFKVSSNWFDLQLEVAAVHPTARTLTGEVTFFLHDTFPNPMVAVQSKENVAILRTGAYGAFTVGAVADGGDTYLELDLTEDESFPLEFRVA